MVFTKNTNKDSNVKTNCDGLFKTSLCTFILIVDWKWELERLEIYQCQSMQNLSGNDKLKIIPPFFSLPLSFLFLFFFQGIAPV